MVSIRRQFDSLFRLADGVALIDMLSSFAVLVSTCGSTAQPFVRPILTKSNTNDDSIVLMAARHVIVSNMTQKVMKKPFVPNNCFLGALENTQIITGPNGSGKVSLYQF